MEHLKLFCHSEDDRVMAVPANDGFTPSADVLRLLEQTEHPCDVISTNVLSEGDRMNLYVESAVPAANRRHPKVKVGRTFGSNRYPGSDFGLAVPALIVYDDDELPIDVYPHERGDGHIVTIREYLLGIAAH